MNKTAIEWCDYTWNPVTGCKHGCPYCYARKIAERFKGSKAWPQGFEPMLHHERLFDAGLISEKPKTVFVCSMADLFGSWVPDQWINFVINSCMFPSNNTYIFLTKNPKRYLTIPGEYLAPSNFWFGATSTGGERPDHERIEILKKLPEGNTFVSFEPLLNDPISLDLTGIKQVIIGAQTNPDKFAGREAVLNICEAADRSGAKVFMKDSLVGRWPGPILRRELCWSVQK